MTGLENLLKVFTQGGVYVKSPQLQERCAMAPVIRARVPIKNHNLGLLFTPHQGNLGIDGNGIYYRELELLYFSKVIQCAAHY